MLALTGRAALYGLIAALALFVLAASFLIERGGGPSQAVLEVSVHDLSVTPQAYARERVSTEGVLRLLDEPYEHAVVTADGLGVVLRGYEIDALRHLDGRTVRVEGRFGFDEENGVYIEAGRVTPVP